MKFEGMQNSPYGDISKWVKKEDVDRYIYVYKVQHEVDDFKPPSTWFCMDSMGNRLYFRARDRKKAMQLMVDFFGSAKYSLIADKSGSIR